MTSRPALSRFYNAAFLGRAGPREMQIYTANHTDSSRVWLTEIHELTHFNLLTSTITGHVQALCDSILSAVDAGPGRDDAKTNYGITADDYDTIALAYTSSIETSRRVHETTACYSEYVMALKHGLKEEYRDILAERSDLYELPLLDDCLLIESRLRPLFDSAALRSQVLYALARLALDRRLVCPVGPSASIGTALSSILNSVEIPDHRFGVLLKSFAANWPYLESVLVKLDRLFADSMNWRETSSSLFLTLLSQPNPNFQKINQFENAYKELLYSGLGLLLTEQPFDDHNAAKAYYVGHVMPYLNAMLKDTTFVLLDREHWVRVAKPRVVYPTDGVQHPKIHITDNATASDLSIIFEQMFLSDGQIARSTMIIHVAEGVVSFPDSSGTQDLRTVPDGSWLATLLVANYAEDDELQSRWEMIFFAEPETVWHFAGQLGDRLLAVIVSSTEQQSDLIARALSASVPLEHLPVFLHPAGSLFVETVEDGPFSLELPARVAFCRDAGGQAGSLVLLKGSGTKAWMFDFVSELQLRELQSWALHTPSVSLISTDPFEAHVLDNLVSACRSSLLRVPGL